MKSIHVVTCVIEGREGEGVVSQGLEEVGDVAPLPKEELVNS